MKDGRHAALSGALVMSSRGFTLIELLVALAVFSIMSVLAFGGLSAVLNASGRTEVSADRLAALQKAFTIIARDVEQAVSRPIRDEFGDIREPLRAGALLNDTLLELSRAGWSNPAGHRRSTLQRVAYRYEDDTLYRSQWAVLDRAQDSTAQERALLADVTAVEVQLLDPEGKWHSDWPPVTAPTVTPKAMEVVVELEDWGEVRRLFLLPGGRQTP